MVRVPCYKDLTTLKKGSWSPEEDQKLKAYIMRFGIWNWTEMPKAAGLSRSGKSCRLRWVNYLKPGIKRGNFSQEEQETILKLHGIMGNRWSAIAARLPGRTDNEIKNYWHTKLRKLKDNPSSPRTKSQAPETPTVEVKPIDGGGGGGGMGYEQPWSPQLSIDLSSSSTTSLMAVGTDYKSQMEGISKSPLSTQPYASAASSSSVTSPAVEIDNKSQMMEPAGTFGDLQAFPMEDLFMLGDYIWGTFPDLGVGLPNFEEWVQEPLWT